MASKPNRSANLLNFTIDVNQTAELSIELDYVNTAEFESLISKLGDPLLGPRIAKVVREYVKAISSVQT